MGKRERYILKISPLKINPEIEKVRERGSEGERK
jgi:hypothetical protein